MAVPPAAASSEILHLGSLEGFTKPSGVAVDEATGNVFVSDSSAGIVKIFGAEGEPAVGLASTEISGFNFCGEPSGVAVDNAAGSPSKGVLYVADICNNAVKKLTLNPATEEYELVGELSASPSLSEPLDVTVDTHGNVFVADWGSSSIVEFSSTGTETGRIDTSSLFHPSSVAVDSLGDLFVQGYGIDTSVYKWQANGSGQIEASTVPTLIVAAPNSGVAVDPSTDQLYTAREDHVEQYDALSGSKVTEFGSGFLGSSERLAADATTDEVLVADKGDGHVEIFGPLPPPAAPVVKNESVSDITDHEAILHASLKPKGAETTYRFKYGTADCSTNPCASVPAQGADIGSGSLIVEVEQSLSGLQADTTYHYLVEASNEIGTAVGEDRTFHTYITPHGLPDDRAYELVTPPDTGGTGPVETTFGEAEGRDCFDISLPSKDGNGFVFGTGEGSLPGTNGTGLNDSYEATRTAAGWVTQLTGPTGEQTEQPQGGHCFSSDHGYWTFETGAAPFDSGSLVVNGEQTSYIRNPDGSVELAGQGSMGTDPKANTRWISAGAGHVIFTSLQQLEPVAAQEPGPGPPPGNGSRPGELVAAIYDRIPGGITHVVSLLPGGTAPEPGTNTYYEGVSRDGSAVFFKVEDKERHLLPDSTEVAETTLYERRDDTNTVQVVVGEQLGSDVFAGVSSDGTRVFYVEPDSPGSQSTDYLGHLFAFDAESETTIPITPGGEAFFVNISRDGSHVYFVSPEQLDGSGGAVGEPNLYVWDWDSQTIRYVATLTAADLSAEKTGNESLRQWTDAVATPKQSAGQGLAWDPSRTTADGSIFVFESFAKLTGYDNDGFREIYRYDTGDESLTCISCNPSGVPATADASLQTFEGHDTTAPLIEIPNVTDDGNVIFFQSREALNPRDVNGQVDVYEWENGEVSLISSGRSPLPSRLLGMTPDGSNVFFNSNDRLVPQDTSEIVSIYDARVDGGFPAPKGAPECQGDTCQQRTEPPTLANPGSSSVGSAGNRRARSRHCARRAKGVRRRHRARCAKHHRHHHRANEHHGGAK